MRIFILFLFLAFVTVGSWFVRSEPRARKQNETRIDTVLLSDSECSAYWKVKSDELNRSK